MFSRYAESEPDHGDIRLLAQAPGNIVELLNC
jgi:hypothetical protein